MTSNIDILSVIASKQSFALYRLPFTKTARLCMQHDGDFTILSDIEQLESGMFVFAPFAETEKCPMLAIRADILCEVSLSKEQVSNKFESNDENSEKEKYVIAFEKFKKQLSAESQRKLVLSRKSEHKILQPFSVLNVFCEAMEKYENSFVYLFYTPQTEFWCGSTMEVLLSGEKGDYCTMAVAGTKRNERKEMSWDAKNVREQALVSEFVGQVLKNANVNFIKTEPFTTQAGDLVHLRTDFSFRLDRKVGNLLKSLHPTPAVCGIPQNSSQQFIIQNEEYCREYYAGFLGMISSDKCDLFVNLRCVKITDDTISFYAGGGLLPESEMESEWCETEAKMKTMKNVIK